MTVDRRPSFAFERSIGDPQLPSGLQVHLPLLVLLAVAIAAGGFRSMTPVGIVLLVAAAGNLLMSVFTVRGVAVRVVDNPTDAVVGDAVAVEVTVEGFRAPVSVRLRSRPDAEWVSARAPERGTVHGIARVRGVATGVEVAVASSWPLGLIGFWKSRWVPLRHPLAVAPRPIAPDEPVELIPAGAPQAGAQVAGAGEGEVTRSVREYRSGDPIRRIAWPVTARTGRLVTRELEQPGRVRVHLVVDLGDEPGRVAERVASTGAWAAAELLDAGAELRLTVRTDDGVISLPADRLVVHRSLAAAVCGAALDASPALHVTPDGIEWR